MYRSELVIATLAERTDLASRINDFDVHDIAEFLYQDRISETLFDPLMQRHPELTIVAVDPAAPDVPVAKLCAMPFTWDGDPTRELPPGGYDAVLLSTAADSLAGRRGNLVSALLAMVQPAARGRGISALMLDAARRNAARLGDGTFVAPGRPTRKHEDQGASMEEYVARVRTDGLPVDPWLRVHARAGGRIVGVAPRSMTITGALAEWRAWTGLPFDTTGPVSVAGGLVPVDCDTTRDIAVYVEPNVWVCHRLR